MMIVKNKPFVWPSEAALCDEFARIIPEGWTCYNEVSGFDMVVVHDATGTQIGVEAKLTLNAKVLVQAMSGRWRCGAGPDFRAVLVGKVVAENELIADELGITVLKLRERRKRGRNWMWQGPERPEFEVRPALPMIDPAPRVTMQGAAWMHREDWHDEAPVKRLWLPDYVPDVRAGCPAPMMLSDWKIKAIRVCVYVERHGSIDRKTFKALGIDPSRWMTGNWLAQAPTRGVWVAGPGFPAESYRRQHPTIYPKIEADYEKWVKEAKIGVAA